MWWCSGGTWMKLRLPDEAGPKRPASSRHTDRRGCWGAPWCWAWAARNEVREERVRGIFFLSAFFWYIMGVGYNGPPAFHSLPCALAMDPAAVRSMTGEVRLGESSDESSVLALCPDRNDTLMLSLWWWGPPPPLPLPLAADVAPEDGGREGSAKGGGN